MGERERKGKEGRDEIMVWVREDDKRNLRPTLYILTYLNGDEGESES